MKRPGRKAALLVVSAVFAPPLIWGLVLVFLPMGWVRARIVSRLVHSTRQEVRLESVRLRPFGGLALAGLEIASPGRADDPWLKIRDLTVDVSLRDVVRGSIAPTEAVVTGLALRVRRDASGRLEFDDLLQADPPPESQDTAASAPRQDAREMAFRIAEAVITVVDESTDTRLELTDVNGHGTHQPNSTHLAELSGLLNGGTIVLTGRVDRAAETSIDAQLRSQDIALSGGMKALSYFIPLVAPMPNGPQAKGTLSFDLDLTARGATSKDLNRSLTGSGAVSLTGLTLENSLVMAEVATLLPINSRGKLGSLTGRFRIADRRVTSDDTVLSIAGAPVGLVGWSDFDGRLDYLVRCEKLAKTVTGLAGRLSPEARELLADLPMEEIAGLANVRVSGTLDDLRVKPAEGNRLSSRGPAKPGARRADDRAKLKAAGKKLLDRMIR